MNEFGKKIKELRGAKSIRESARGIGISHTYLDSLEKGYDPRTGKERKPTVDVVHKIAKYYEYDFVTLLASTEMFSSTSQEDEKEIDKLKALIKQDNNDIKSNLQLKYEKLFTEDLKHSQLTYLRRVYDFLKYEEDRKTTDSNDNGLVIIDVILRSLLESGNSGNKHEYYEIVTIFSNFLKKRLNIKDGD